MGDVALGCLDNRCLDNRFPDNLPETVAASGHLSIKTGAQSVSAQLPVVYIAYHFLLKMSAIVAGQTV